jgi:putative transposase
MENNRKYDGKKIAEQPDQIKRIDDNWYQVKSQSLGFESWYDVVLSGPRFVCDCPDNQWRKTKCKHVYAVEFSLLVRKEVWKDVRIDPLSTQNCRFCNSENIIKRGFRKAKNNNIQRFYCNDCKKWFTFNVGFEKMRASPQVITSAMQLYFTGESLRNVTKFLRLQGVEISHVAVYKWIKKYVGLMEQYLEKIPPKVSDTWRADEMYLKVKGNTKYLYAMMDDETRFWIAQQVSSEKNTATVRPMFKKAKEYAGKRPDVLITDGAINFQDAFNKEYWTMKNPRPLHVRHITIKGDRNNNKMERLNNEIRDREKTFRGLKKMDTPIIEGYRIYHNYVRPHMALEGKTPADMAGIMIEGENKWITLIQNASKIR